MTKASLYRRSKSNNPNVAFPALVKLGALQVVSPTTDTGPRSYGLGKRFLPAATNYCTNPSLEVGTGGLATGFIELKSTAASGTYTQVAGRLGGLAQRMVYNSAADTTKYLLLYYYTAAASFAPNENAAYSVYIKGAIAGCTCTLYLIAKSNAEAALGQVTTAVTPAAGYARVSVLYPTLPAGTDHLEARVQFAAIDTGDTIDVTFDDVLIEKATQMSAYFDGMYEGCAWTGAVNASTSTRPASPLRYTFTGPLSGMFGSSGGGFAARFIPEFANGFNVEPFFTPDADPWVMITTSKARTRISAAPDTWADAATGAFVSGSVHAFVSRWDTSGLDTTWDDTASAHAARAAAIGAASYIDLGAVSFGGYVSPGAWLGPVVLFKTRPSDALAASISTALRAGVSAADLYRNYMSVGDAIIPLNGDTRCYVKVSGGACPFDISSTDFIAFDGNSLVYGDQGVVVHGVNDYPTQCLAMLNTGRNVAARFPYHNGMGTDECTTVAPAWLDAYADKNYRSRTVVFFEGVNSMNNGTQMPVTELASWDTYCTARRAAGFGHIIVCTLPTGNDPGRNAFAITKGFASWDALVQDFNSRLRASHAFADAVVDIYADSHLGNVANCGDGVWFADNTHLTVAGYAVVAGLVKTAIRSLL